MKSQNIIFPLVLIFAIVFVAEADNFKGRIWPLNYVGNGTYQNPTGSTPVECENSTECWQFICLLTNKYDMVGIEIDRNCTETNWNENLSFIDEFGVDVYSLKKTNYDEWALGSDSAFCESIGECLSDICGMSQLNRYLWLNPVAKFESCLNPFGNSLREF